MSLALWPAFKPRLRGVEFDGLGELFVHNFEALDRIARAVKVTPFSAFAGDTGWFEAKDGRVTFQALADYLKAKPKEAKKIDGVVYLVEELEELVRVLTIAEARGVKFCLELV